MWPCSHLPCLCVSVAWVCNTWSQARHLPCTSSLSAALSVCTIRSGKTARQIPHNQLPRCCHLAPRHVSVCLPISIAVCLSLCSWMWFAGALDSSASVMVKRSFWAQAALLTNRACRVQVEHELHLRGRVLFDGSSGHRAGGAAQPGEHHVEARCVPFATLSLVQMETFHALPVRRCCGGCRMCCVERAGALENGRSH